MEPVLRVCCVIIGDAHNCDDFQAKPPANPRLDLTWLSSARSGIFKRIVVDWLAKDLTAQAPGG